METNVLTDYLLVNVSNFSEMKEWHLKLWTEKICSRITWIVWRLSDDRVAIVQQFPVYHDQSTSSVHVKVISTTCMSEKLFGCTHWSLRISQPYLYAICVKTVSTNHFFLQFTTETVSLLVFDRLLNTITNTVNWSSSVFYMKNGDIRSRCKFNTFDFPSEFGRVFRKCLW